MTRTNPPGSLSDWLKRAAAAPFRASINGDCEWGTNRPSPDLIGFARMSPGGRMLMAFGAPEVRDYFVDGHLDQGAQVEPDYARRAAAKAEVEDPMTCDVSVLSAESLANMSDAYALAHHQERQADENLALYVLPRIAAFREVGSTDKAAALAKVLPSMTQAKMQAWDALKAADEQVIRLAQPAPLDRDLSVLLLDWQRARRRERAIGDAYGQRAIDHGRDLFDRGQTDELATFIATVRHGWARASLSDMERYGTPKPTIEDSPTP